MIFDKHKLARYIITKHKEKQGCDISPLKLQKTLYMIYAMWSGNAAVINEDIDDGNIELTDKLPEELFKANFEAWKYGPVDIDVYREFKDGKYIVNLKNIEDAFIDDAGDLECKEDIKKFANSIMDHCFNINDFSLVTVAQDGAWEKAYDKNDKIISKEDIRTEYYENIKNKE